MVASDVVYALHMRDEVDDASVDVQLTPATSGTCTSAPIAAPASSDPLIPQLTMEPPAPRSPWGWNLEPRRTRPGQLLGVPWVVRDQSVGYSPVDRPIDPRLSLSTEGTELSTCAHARIHAGRHALRMSRSDPTWYGAILLSYAAWIVAVALAAAAWPMWRWVLNFEGWGDPFARLGWVIVAFGMVVAGVGLVLTRLFGLPGLSGLVTLGCLKDKIRTADGSGRLDLRTAAGSLASRTGRRSRL